ncbi:MAG TPA: penicillin acylase family protein, partial [Usitatibacter sp.]|nr:penicillin acylase family protein [Usitatibacter sp.]
MALGAAAAGWLYLRASLPKIDGDATVGGLVSPVEVLRDRDGVPHILAMNDHDGWFALGYVHAQDRLWQMEFQRRVAQGRLSELLGEKSYDVDRLMRTLGLARLADRIVAKMDAPTRSGLEAYAAGVNAFIDSKPVLPVEFQVFRVKPERWKPADTMGWLLVMSWDLSSNWRSELARLRFSAALGRERAQELMPPYPGDAPYVLPDFKSLYADLAPSASAMLAALPTHEEAVGSNNWVVDGTLTTTGKPLLANDPHLGLQAPSLWYLAHISTPNGNVVGGTLPGVPFVVLGRNDDVAWSMTTTNSDTEDLFVEKVVAGDPASYATPHGTARFEVREEVIRVKDEERRITVRSTRHGPVISDVVKSAADALPRDRVLALSWAALTEDNAVVRAGFALNRAKDGAGVVEALRDFTSPHQNVVYADRKGRVGFVAPARVPVRRADNEAMGRVPVPGWDEKYDWQGIIAFEKLPQYQDPPTHRIVTANHKITPPGYEPFISSDWFPPYRADRIEEMLAAQPKHSIETFQRMQADVLSHLARVMLPFARDAKPESSLGREAQAMLTGWNGEMKRDAQAPLVFSAWYRELTRLVYADELGPMFATTWEQRLPFMLSVLKGENGMAHWCDNVNTPGVESCAQLTAKAFDLAAEDLGKRYGKPAGWLWGRAHFAAGDHRPFGFVPVLDRIFNVDPETP